MNTKHEVCNRPAKGRKTLTTAILALSMAACGPMPPMDPETRAALLGYYLNKSAINQANQVPIYDPDDWKFQPITTPRVTTCNFSRFSNQVTCY